MSRRDNIICFAKDWHEDPTSNHHVMIELAKQHRVLWLNSVATRTPNLTSGRDLGKIVRKLRSFGRGPQQVADNLWVYTPLVLPFPHSALARSVNRQILRATIRALRLKLRMGRFQLWTFLPNVADYVGNLGESLSVYYCVDEWSLFSYIDTASTVEAERQLCSRVDAVFAVCHALVDKKKQYNPETHLATHGVDYDLFAKALRPETEVPAELASLPKPVIGFYGTLQDWVDYDIIAHLAEKHPEWSIVLLGTVLVDVSKIDRYDNVHILGRKSHSELPNYCKGFDVGLIPYRISERMKYVNPLKLREYLSAGVPVVSTAVPEVRYYAEHCTIAETAEEFQRGVAAALAGDSADKRQARSEAMRGETWAAKVAATYDITAGIAERKG